MYELNFEIYAVDEKTNRKALIGTCFNLGVAKTWAKEATLWNDIIIVSKSSGEIWKYKQGDYLKY